MSRWGAPTQDQPQTADKTRLRVAFVVSEQFNIIDFAGPWEVFNDAKLPIEGKQRGDWPRLFENYTVFDSTSPVRTSGNHATLVPAFTFRNAPKPRRPGQQHSRVLRVAQKPKCQCSNGYVRVHRRGQARSRRSLRREIGDHSPCIAELLQRRVSEDNLAGPPAVRTIHRSDLYSRWTHVWDRFGASPGRATLRPACGRGDCSLDGIRWPGLETEGIGGRWSDNPPGGDKELAYSRAFPERRMPRGSTILSACSRRSRVRCELVSGRKFSHHASCRSTLS